MLTIRREQIEVLRAHMMRKYEDRVMRKIVQTYPAKFTQEGEAKIRLFVQAGIRKAELYGITEDDDVEEYVLLLADKGVDFEKAPECSECKAVLEDKGLPASAKLSLIHHKLSSDNMATEQN